MKVYLKEANGITDYQRRGKNGHKLIPDFIKTQDEKHKFMSETAAFECPKCGGCVIAYSMEAWRCLTCGFNKKDKK